MYAQFDDSIASPKREKLEAILRACVHCGFCNATCPTYRLTGNELDGPRGRIYLVKQMLEGQPATRITQTHLDRCLTCLACETTCPSGVRYSRLAEAGREIAEHQVRRGITERWQLRILLSILPYPKRFAFALRIARRATALLPSAWRRQLPPPSAPATWPTARHSRKMLALPTCVQSTLSPAIDASAAAVLDRLGISLIAIANGSCCGAVPLHLSAGTQARAMARRNIDACLPYLEQGFEAVVSTASACGLMAKDYGRLLADDPDYAPKARYFSSFVKDIAEVLQTENISVLSPRPRTIVFHSPCTLQHGQKLSGLPESILVRLGFRLLPLSDGNLCCGAAGTYSLLQPDLSEKLRNAKLKALQNTGSDLIASANIGCLIHLQAAEQQKIVHWLELLQ